MSLSEEQKQQLREDIERLNNPDNIRVEEKPYRAWNEDGTGLVDDWSRPIVSESCSQSGVYVWSIPSKGQVRATASHPDNVGGFGYGDMQLLGQGDSSLCSCGKCNRDSGHRERLYNYAVAQADGRV